MQEKISGVQKDRFVFTCTSTVVLRLIQNIQLYVQFKLK